MKLKIHEFQKIIKVMSKNFLYLLFLIPIISFSQVGVNTTAPNAMLDVQSTSNGVLIPRVQLTSITDNATITNPAGGALTTSTLVYNMAPAGVSPNDVIPGFYYWDNTASRWIPIGGNTTSDHDWYEEGTTSPPDAITDKMFHTGNVAIGKNTTNSPLEVETNAEFETGIKNNFTSNVSQGVARKGFYNELIINSNDQSVGINSVLTGTGSGYQYGISNEISNTNNGNHIGAYNYLNGNGNGYHSGTENYLQGSGDGIHTGTKNEVVNSGNNVNHGSLNEIHGSGTGEHYGTFNSLFGSGSGPQVGTANSINNSEDNTHTGTSNTITSSGDGANYGVFNNLNGTGHGYQYGNFSLIQNTGAGYHFGNYLNMIGTGSGNRYGNYTAINNNNLGDNFGSYSVLTGGGNGYHYGSFNSLGGDGNGEHTANYNIVSGTGIGTKYGTKNIVPVFAGGRHFGVYSEVLKPGSTNFAGYFLGNVGIGTTTLNTYTLPPSRGTNGQIMRTDGFGNVTWQDLTSHAWDLNGNTAITSPATPITYGTSTIGATENFLGTTDNNDVTVGTNNIERMRIKNTTGNVGIGTANPSSTLEIVSGGTTELKLSSRAFFGPTRFSMISDKELPDEWRPTFIESADNGSFTGRMDFFTNGTGIANKFGSLRAMSITNGKVGVGTINPAEKVHVFDSSDANKSSIYSEARQISTGTDYDNIAIKGYGRAMPSWGFGNGVMGIGDTANSYHATGVYAHLGSAAPVLPSTNQALYANGNNLGNAGIFMGGNVGINTQTPTLAKLQVDGMVGSTTALFRGNSTTSQGLSFVADWPGIYFNSYSAGGGVRTMAGSGYTAIINTDQSSGGLVFQTTNTVNAASGSLITVPVRMTIAGNGNVGIGAPTPSNLLHVNSASSGAVRIVDGTEATGRVLTSNAAGVGTWQPVGINNVVGGLNGTGVTINYLQGPYLQTGSSIALPPGKYAVNVNMLMARLPLVLTPDNSFFWVRSTFSDSSGVNPTPSGDIVGSNLISGNFPGSGYYSLLTGTIIINNTTPGIKLYYYVAGNVVTNNTTGFITNFGSSVWAEDNIIAYRLN